MSSIVAAAIASSASSTTAAMLDEVAEGLPIVSLSELASAEASGECAPFIEGTSPHELLRRMVRHPGTAVEAKRPADGRTALHVAPHDTVVSTLLGAATSTALPQQAPQAQRRREVLVVAAKA